MKFKPHELIQLPEFKKLVRTRWTVSFFLLILLFVNYYGFILIITLRKDLVTERIGNFANYGLLAAPIVILISWILTFVYVFWANRFYDKDVKALKEKLEH